MKIGIDASRVTNNQPTGVENYAFHIIEYLMKILPEHIEVVLYSREPLKEPFVDLPKQWSSKVLRWPPKRLWTQIRLSFEMLMHRPDVLFIPAHVFPLIHPKKTIMTVHDVAAFRFPASYNWFERWYSLWSARYAARKLWKVITPTVFSKKELIEYVGVDRGNIHVTPLGMCKEFGVAHVSVSADAVRSKYGITKPYIMSVGRLEKKKNTVRMIEAFDEIKKQHDIQLLLIGKPGHGYEDVQKALQNSPYKEDIITPGFVPEEDVVTLLSQAQLFLFPSLYEGFGIPVLEAFTMDIPVVASKGNSLEEVGGDAVLYVDPSDVSDIANTTIRVLGDEQLRTNMIAKGRRQCLLFSWKQTAQKTKEILLSD